jgi:SSS family solute:Na+ symporter
VAAGLAGLFLLAFLSPRANKQGVYIGIAACLLFTTWATLTSGKEALVNLGRWNFKLHPVMIGVLAHLVLLIVGYTASRCFAAPEPGTRALTVWGWLERKELNSVNKPKELNGLRTGQEVREVDG